MRYPSPILIYAHLWHFRAILTNPVLSFVILCNPVIFRAILCFPKQSQCYPEKSCAILRNPVLSWEIPCYPVLASAILCYPKLSCPIPVSKPIQKQIYSTYIPFAIKTQWHQKVKCDGRSDGNSNYKRGSGLYHTNRIYTKTRKETYLPDWNLLA